MRIIAGEKKGMNLLPPRRHDTRPITDRAKEALFSVLYKYDVIPEGVVADLFCGTGSMGLECLSRGARWVTFVDKDHKVIEPLHRNIEKARFAAESKVIRANAFKTGAPLPSGDAAQENYNLVFVDPPYKLAYETDLESPLGRLLLLLNEQVIDDGIVVVRTNKRTTLLDAYDQLQVVDRRQWGTMAVTLLQLTREKLMDS
ncbi:MAG: RsmD family RNA methyltransferase [Sedimentisphaerales bacterium]|nr:RsmD family RNA methyltransferase [Sedimentisphaerales bacterium]